MDYFPSFPPLVQKFLFFHTNATATSTLLILICSLIFWIARIISRTTSKKKQAPEAGGAWPLIGHLHHLGGPKPPHIVLTDMAHKYGPIFTIKMGLFPALVVSNWEIAKECLTINDKAFANRPKTLAAELLGYDHALFGLEPYTTYWRQMRKISTRELLSNNRLEDLRHVRESEVVTALKELYKLWELKKINISDTVLVEMRRWFSDISSNVILRIISGKSVGYETTNYEGEENEKLKKALRDFFDLTGRFVVADAIPFLRCLDIGGYEKAMKKTAKALDIVVEGWLKEHKEKKASGFKKEKEDFMDMLLDIFYHDAEAVLGQESHILKDIPLTLTLAASDTTAVTLIWVLSLLINNPDVLKKAQQELDINVGKERRVQESDMNNLVYLKAIIKETLRLYPAAPLSLPHEAMEDCTVAGCHIPAGTRLVVNLSKIQRDPSVWSNPNEFQPERFLTTHKDYDVRGQHYELIPFGSGRRMCPGISFALQVLQLTMATLLQGFDFANPTGEPVDMSESIGLTNIKATPLECLLSPRLQPHLYQ